MYQTMKYTRHSQSTFLPHKSDSNWSKVSAKLTSALCEKYSMYIVALSACDYTQSEIRNVLTCWQTIHSFSSRQWMTQWWCVYELSNWYNTQLICVKRIKNSWMTISSVRISYPAECNCHLLLWKTSESFSCLLLSIQTSVYKPM